MNHIISLDFIGQILSFKKGLMIPGNHSMMNCEDSDLAIKLGVLEVTKRRVVCGEHDVVCKVKHEGDKLFAYHTEIVPHRYEIEETDTYAYSISYSKLLLYLVEHVLSFGNVCRNIQEDNEFVWGDLDFETCPIRVILAPSFKEGAIDHLYGHVGSLDSQPCVVVITFEDIPENRLGAFRILTSGFGVCASVENLKVEEYLRLMVRHCRFLATVKSSVSQLRSSALAQVDFGLDVNKFGDERVVVPALLDADFGRDWIEFEKLCRYVFSRILPCALKGYGQGDSGPLPDSIGVIPDENNLPSKLVLFDSKALVSRDKVAFSFDKTIVGKNADYIETAERLSKKLGLRSIALLFVAPSFSVENLRNFERNLEEEVERRKISAKSDLIFLTLGALMVLFFMESDQSQSVVIRSKDPSRMLIRILLTPSELRGFLEKKGLSDDIESLKSLRNALLIDERLLNLVLGSFMERDEHYAQYFEEYRRIAQDRFR